MKRTVIVSMIAAVLACRADGPAPLAVSDGQVTSVSIERGREAFVLVQDSPGIWRVDELHSSGPDEADEDGAAALLAGLRALRLGARVSDSGGAYGLGPADATAVRVYTRDRKEPALTLRFGRRALGRAVHVQSAETSAVYQAEGPDPDLLARGASDWRRRRLLRSPCVEATLDAGRGPRAAAPETVAALCALRATAALPSAPSFTAGLEPPFLRVRSPSGAFDAGARVGAERWVRVEGRAVFLRVPAAPLDAAAASAR